MPASKLRQPDGSLFRGWRRPEPGAAHPAGVRRKAAFAERDSECGERTEGTKGGQGQRFAALAGPALW